MDKSEKICAYCEFATTLFDGESMLCKKNGVVGKSNSCRKFSYDPIKRVPPKKVSAPTLDYIDIDN